MLAALEFCITALKRELASGFGPPFTAITMSFQLNALAIADQRFIFLPF
jgi:hypothetical protein